MFIPKIGVHDPIWRAYFWNGMVQPPTSHLFAMMSNGFFLGPQKTPISPDFLRHLQLWPKLSRSNTKGETYVLTMGLFPPEVMKIISAKLVVTFYTSFFLILGLVFVGDVLRIRSHGIHHHCTIIWIKFFPSTLSKSKISSLNSFSFSHESLFSGKWRDFLKDKEILPIFHGCEAWFWEGRHQYIRFEF